MFIFHWDGHEVLDQRPKKIKNKKIETFICNVKSHTSTKMFPKPKFWSNILDKSITSYVLCKSGFCFLNMIHGHSWKSKTFFDLPQTSRLVHFFFLPFPPTDGRNFIWDDSVSG